MPNITINASATDVAAQRSTPVGNQKKKNKRFRKKMRLLQQKGYLEGKHKHNHCTGQSGHDQTLGDLREWLTRPRPPTSTQNNSSPPPGSSSHCSSKPSSSTHSQPSLTLTVNNKGSDEKPKESVNTKTAATTPGPSGSSSHKPTATSAPVPTKYLAIDCEMVGTGPKGSISHLARCSIVSYYGDVIYDKFINPPVPVTDYRTRWSGIRRSDLARAMPFSEARKEILKLLMGKVVIGHAIHNDFKVLSYSHPSALTRDTSRIPLLNQKAGFAEHECASLKRLTKAIFNRDIQTGRKGHSSVEDARATMELYKVVEVEWERRLATKSQTS